MTAGTGISIVNNAINNTAPNVNQNLSIAGQTLSISGGNSVTLPTPAAPAAQNLSISGQQLSISGGNSVTLPAAVAPPATNIYNTDGSIPVGITRTVIIPENPNSVNQTKLEIKAIKLPNSGATSPEFRITAPNYSNPAYSNFLVDVGAPIVHTTNTINVLCQPHIGSYNDVGLRTIQLGLSDMPPSNSTAAVNQKRNWINGKEEKVAIFQMTLSTLNNPNGNSVQFVSGPLTGTQANLKAHKVTLFNNSNKYLECFMVDTALNNGTFRIEAYCPIATNGMFPVNQSGAQMSAIVYYTE